MATRRRANESARAAAAKVRTASQINGGARFTPPIAEARSYRAKLRRYFAAVNAEILRVALEGWEAYLETGRVDSRLNDVDRRDASPFSKQIPHVSRFVRKKIDDIWLKLEEAHPPEKLADEIGMVAERVNKRGRVEFRKVIGINLRSELGIGEAIDAFRERNVRLIKSLQRRQLDEVTDVLAQAEAGGWRVEELRKTLLKTFDVTKAKADLLARDQVLKLNGQLTQHRQTNAGITQYVWRTSKDERVRGRPGGVNPRGLHYYLDGTLQSWDSPPVVSEDGRREHPGGDYQCRCIADPVLPELEGVFDD